LGDDVSLPHYLYWAVFFWGVSSSDRPIWHTTSGKIRPNNSATYTNHPQNVEICDNIGQSLINGVLTETNQLSMVDFPLPRLITPDGKPITATDGFSCTPLLPTLVKFLISDFMAIQIGLTFRSFVLSISVSPGSVLSYFNQGFQNQVLSWFGMCIPTRPSNRHDNKACFFSQMDSWLPYFQTIPDRYRWTRAIVFRCFQPLSARSLRMKWSASRSPWWNHESFGDDPPGWTVFSNWDPTWVVFCVLSWWMLVTVPNHKNMGLPFSERRYKYLIDRSDRWI